MKRYILQKHQVDNQKIETVTEEFTGKRLTCLGGGGRLFLILDGHSMHQSNEVAKKVRAHGGRLRLYWLPPYSPGLNPDDAVWRKVKSDQLGRAGVFGLAEMKSEAYGTLSFGASP